MAKLEIAVNKLTCDAESCFTVIKNIVFIAAQNNRSDENPDKYGYILLHKFILLLMSFIVIYLFPS